MLPDSISYQSINRRALKVVLVTLLGLTVASCGFHLRGNIPLSDGIKNLSVTAPNGPFSDKLAKRLVNLGANLVEPEVADAFLNIESVISNRDVGTLDERGKVNSYDVKLVARYTIEDAAGQAIRPKSVIRESRRYNFDPDTVIESESEEADLIEDMEDAAVLKLIRRLASITDFDPSKVKRTTK